MKYLPKTRIVGLAVIAALTAAHFLFTNSQWQSAHDAARETFVFDNSSEMRMEAVVIERGFQSIYENLRTLSSLPGVRNLDRHAQNLQAETRVAIQHIYNNLASNTSVSEVYFTPISFEPALTDPVTGKSEEPIIMFDELILNAGLGMSAEDRFNAPEQVKAAEIEGPAEVEIFEYEQLKEQAQWFMTHHPTISKKGTLDIPFIASPEVITCDNTYFLESGKDADRSGIIFSVPFYDTGGKIKGMVSAIVLTRAIQALIHNPHYALVNTGNNYAVLANNSQIPESSLEFVRSARPDPSQVYSEAQLFGVKDWRNPWHLWASKPNSAFLNSKNAVLADQSRSTALSAMALIAAVAVAGLLLLDRLLQQSRALTLSAEMRETEAVATAANFKALNDSVSRLNFDLADKVRELNFAQSEIVKKAKMAQLGEMAAMVAHEIRNPLGSIRTAGFMLRRKMKSPSEDQTKMLDRIDGGVERCDGIVTELLDFSRTERASGDAAILDEWLAKTLEDEALALSPAINIVCELGLGDRQLIFDPQRLRRAVVNLITNACESMLDSKQNIVRFKGLSPLVRVTTRMAERGVEIEVADNGPGIPDNVLARIREPLFTTKSFGTGLGVPAVEKIAQLHGGGLDITTHLGEGSRFTIWLPLKLDTDQHQAVA